MLIPLALFVALLVATAFIAHWSDNLGKKLGKKRVSVFGLRPRTSATLLTVASSWGIMIFTLTALLLTVAPLRNALFYYEQAKKDTALLKGDVQIARDDLDSAKAETTNYQKQAANYQKQVTIFQNDALKFQNEAKRGQKNFQNAQRGEQNARRATQAARKRQKQAVAALESAQRKLSSSQKQLSTNQSELQRGKAEIKRANFELKSANAELKQTQQEEKTAQLQKKVAEAERRIAETNRNNALKDFTQAKKDFTQADGVVKRLGPQVVSLAKQVAGLQQQKTELEQQKKELGINIAAAKAEAARNFDIADGLSEVALNDIRLPVDQTLAERRIDAEQSPEQIEKELRILIGDSQNATKDFVPGATLTARAIVPDPQTKERIQLDETQTIQVFARLLSASNQTVSARLAAAANYPLNSTEVLGRFVFVPVRTIYKSHDTIAEARIDANKSESAIFGQLNKLVDEARFNAVKRGSSPPLSLDAKNFFDGDTGQKQFNAWHQVQKLGGTVPVRIVAARDLDSAEPLQVRFLVGDDTA